MKSDITYEFRKTSKRPYLTVGNLELGICKSNVFFNELTEPYDGPSTGRIYHLTDTDQFYYDLEGKRYELSLIGNASSDELKKEIDSIKKILDKYKGLTDEQVELLGKLDDFSNFLDDYAKKSDLNLYLKKEDASKKYQPKGNYLTNDDLSDYAKKSDLYDDSELRGLIDSKQPKGNYLTEHQSLEGYAKIEDIPSISGLATEKYVTDEIAKAKLESNDVDLSSYLKSEDADKTYIKKSELVTYTEGNGISISDNVISVKIGKLSDDDSDVEEGLVEASELNEIINSLKERISELEDNTTDEPVVDNDKSIVIYTNQDYIGYMREYVVHIDDNYSITKVINVSPEDDGSYIDGGKTFSVDVPSNYEVVLKSLNPITNEFDIDVQMNNHELDSWGSNVYTRYERKVVSNKYNTGTSTYQITISKK